MCHAQAQLDSSHHMRLAASRLAREEAANSYAVVCEDASLSISTETGHLTVTDSARTLMHTPIRSLLFGASASKLMLVPLDRSPAYLLECPAEPLASLVAALSREGIHVASAPERVTPPVLATEPAAELDCAAIERLVATPSFQRHLAHVEGILATRRSLGLPELQ